MGFAVYQRAGRCTGEAQPGAEALMAYLLGRFPTARNGGIYNCRKVAGTGSRSVHGEGRALDPMCKIDTGRRIVTALLPVVGRLGVQAIIHDRKFYSAASPMGRYYDGANPHRDHPHIELSWAAALYLNLTTIRAVFGGRVPASQPPKPLPIILIPPPIEKDPDMPVIVRNGAGNAVVTDLGSYHHPILVDVRSDLKNKGPKLDEYIDNDLYKYATSLPQV